MSDLSGSGGDIGGHPELVHERTELPRLKSRLEIPHRLLKLGRAQSLPKENQPIVSRQSHNRDMVFNAKRTL